MKNNKPFYDPLLSYDDNYDKGPFGAFADGFTLKQKDKPLYDYHGEKVYLPFGIPAGPLLNSRYVRAAFEAGFDICVYKTVRSQASPCHAFPNVLPLDFTGDLTPQKTSKPITIKKDYSSPLSITNSFGVPSKNPEEWQSDAKQAIASAGAGQVCVLSFMGTVMHGQTKQEFIDDNVRACELALECNPKIVEVNLSCPNVGNEGLICYDLQMTANIMEKLSRTVGSTPLLMKIGYFDSDDDLLEIAEIADRYAAGICAINTIGAKIVNKDGSQALPGKNRLKSGVCGEAIKWAGIEMVKKLVKIRTQNNYSFSIEGMGGVMREKDYLDYVSAGADAVFSATGAMWNPYLAQEIKKQMTFSKH